MVFWYRRGRGMQRDTDPIAAMFPAGKLGVSVEPYILSTLSQDTAGATPITAAGDPVGRAFSRFGGGYHPVQATALSKPLYKIDGDGAGYLELDNTNDTLVTPSVPWGADEVTIIAAVMAPRTAGQTVIAGIGGVGAANYARLVRPAAANMYMASGGSTVITASDTTTDDGTFRVVAMRAKISSPLLQFWRGGVMNAQNVNTQGTGVYATGVVSIGALNGGSFFGGRLYGLICVNWIAPTSVVDRAARYMAAAARKAYA